MGSNVPIQMEVGAVWGEWTVLGLSHSHPVSGNRYWNARCSCGYEKAVEGSRLRKGKTTRCQRCAGRENGRKGLYTKSKDCKYLYFVRCGGYVKIGVTSDVERRMKDMKTHCPYDMQLLKVEENKEGLEEYYHNLYKDKHHRGEWFRIGGACEI